jgi:hypothetical protein
VVQGKRGRRCKVGHIRTANLFSRRSLERLIQSADHH